MVWVVHGIISPKICLPDDRPSRPPTSGRLMIRTTGSVTDVEDLPSQVRETVPLVPRTESGESR